MVLQHLATGVGVGGAHVLARLGETAVRRGVRPVGLYAVPVLGDQVGPVRGELFQILLLGVLRPLLVGRFVVGIQVVPHGSHMLGHLAKGGVRVPLLNPRLHVSEEQRVRRHRLLRLVGVPLLLVPPGLSGPLLHHRHAPLPHVVGVVRVDDRGLARGLGHHGARVHQSRLLVDAVAARVVRVGRRAGRRVVGRGGSVGVTGLARLRRRRGVHAAPGPVPVGVHPGVRSLLLLLLHGGVLLVIAVVVTVLLLLLLLMVVLLLLLMVVVLVMLLLLVVGLLLHLLLLMLLLLLLLVMRRQRGNVEVVLVPLAVALEGVGGHQELVPARGRVGGRRGSGRGGRALVCDACVQLGEGGALRRFRIRYHDAILVAALPLSFSDPPPSERDLRVE